MKVKGLKSVNFGKMGGSMFIVQKDEVIEIPNTEAYKKAAVKGMEDGFIEIVESGLSKIIPKVSKKDTKKDSIEESKE